MNKYIIAVAVVLAVLGGAYFLMNRNNTANEMPAPANAPAPSDQINSALPPAGGSAPTSVPASASKNTTVTIQDFSFAQPLVNIKKGDTVVWTNKDSAPHTVTGDSGGPSSPTINSNGSYSFKFDTAGTFSYHCAFHPSMKAKVVVSE